MGGLLIVFEGIDASGKTTQARLLAEELKARGMKVVLTKEPFLELPAIAGLIAGAGSISDYKDSDTLSEMRGYSLAPETDALLFAVDRSEHIHKVVNPSLADGKTVVSDRSYLSSIAYQSTLEGLDPKWVRTINYFAPEPDIVFFLDIDPKKALKRIAGQANRKFAKFETLEKQQKVRATYLEMARKGDWIVIKGDEDKDVVHANIIQALKTRKIL